MGQKSSVPIQTTVLSSNPAAPPVRKKPPAPLPPYRNHSFVIPENKVLPTVVAPRRLRPVSVEMARTNSDFASIWGNPVTALDEQIRDSLQKESLDRHAANLASIIAGVEAKHVPSKNDVSLSATSAPFSDPQRGQNPDANYQGPIEGLSSNSVPSKTQTLNSESSLGPKSEESEESSFRFQNQEKNLQNLSVSAKENVIRTSSAPPSYKTNGEIHPNGGLPGENFPSGGLPLDFTSHRRNPSTSTFSSQPIFIDESEENASFASDTFSRISNTSLPQKCSFNLDRTQSLTYAQLAESRRQNSPLSNLDLNSRSQLSVNHSSNRNGEIDFSVQSVDRRKSRKKKRAPDPPKGASPFSVSSHDEREERNVLDVLPEQEPPGKSVWSLAETESEKGQNNSHAQVKVSEEEVGEKPREAFSSLPKWYTASSSSPASSSKWYTASSSSPASKPNVLGDPSLTYRNLITPVQFKTESAKSAASCVPAQTTLESKSVDASQLPPVTSSGTTLVSTFTTAFEPASTNAQPELDNGAQITNQPVLIENKPTVSLPEETTNIITTEELKTSSDLRLPDTTSAFKQITVDQPDFIEPSIELQSHYRNLAPPLASSESYEPKSNKDEPLFQPQEQNNHSLSSATQDTSTIWKPPTQDDISMLLASSEKIQNNKTLENNLMKETLGDFHGNLQPDSIYVKRSKTILKEENKQVNPIMEVPSQPPEVKNTTETLNAVNEQNVNPNPNPNPSNSQQIKKIENELSSSSLNDLKTNSTLNKTIVSTNNYLSTNVHSLANSVTTSSTPVNYISTSSPYGGGVVPPQSIPTSIVSTALPQTNSFLFNFATNQTVPLSQYIVSSSNGTTPHTLTTTPQVSNSQLGQQVTYSVLPHYNTLPATLQPNLPQLALYSTATQLDPQVANLAKIPTLIVNPDGKVIAPLPPGAQLLPGFVPAAPMVSSQFPGTTQAQGPLSETESVTLPRSASNLMPNLTQQIQEVALKRAKAKSQNESYHSPLLVNPVSNISSESGTSPSSTPQVPPPPLPPPPPPPAPPLPPLEPSVLTSSFVPSGRDSPLAKVLMAAHKSGAASSVTSRRSSNSTTDSDSVKGLQHIQREDILAARSSLRSRKDRISKPVTRSQSDNPHEMFQKELNQVILVRKKKYNESPKSITAGRAVGDGEAVSNVPVLSNDNRTNSKDNSNSQMAIEPNSRGQSSNSSEIGSITSNSSVISNSSKLEKTSVSITQARTSPQNMKNTVWLTNIDVHRSRSLKEKEEKNWTPEQDLDDFEEKENGDGGANNGRGAFISSGFKANLVPGNIKQFCPGFQSGQTSLKKNKTFENNETVGEKTEKPLIVWESQDSLLDGSVSVSSNWSFKASDTSDLDAGSEKKSKKEGRKKDEVPAPDKKANRFSFPVAKTKENPDKRPLAHKKSSGIVYGSHGEIMFLPGFQNADNDENHVTDENAGNAPKWRSKKKKYAFQSTVKLNEKERLELELASRVQARERQMEEERLAQRRTELEFSKMRSYMCYPEERVSHTISSQVSSSSNEQSRTTTMESKAKQPVRKIEREFAVAGSDDGVILRQVTSIGDRKGRGREVGLGVKKANGEVEAPAKSKKRTSKQGNEPDQKVSNPDSKPISGFENASSNHPPKEKLKTGTKSNHPRTLNPHPTNHPNPGLLSNPPLGASLPNLAFFNDYLKLLSATQTIVPNLYQQNLNPAFFASNPNLINQVNPFYSFFVNPMSTGDTSGVFGGMAYNQQVPNGVQNPMYASDESDKDDDEDDTESIYQSMRQNRTDYTSSCSSDQGKDLDNSYSTQSSSVAYTSTECSRDRDDKSSEEDSECGTLVKARVMESLYASSNLIHLKNDLVPNLVGAAAHH